jgi:acyl-CoA hydrolase
MAASDPPRTVEQTGVEMTEIVLPEDTNHRGSVFGGRVLALIDKCAAVAAMRHARTEVITAAVDSVVFLSGVKTGDILLLTGRLNAAFQSSMEAEVQVRSEDPLTGERRLTTTAFVTMVSVAPDGSPQRIPPLEATSAEERRRAREAAARREHRLRERRRREPRD